MVASSRKILPSCSHNLLTGRQTDLWKLSIQIPLAWCRDVVARTRQMVNPSEKCFVVCGAAKSDLREPIGKRNLAGVQFL
jgi:hypothetical protein